MFQYLKRSLIEIVIIGFRIQRDFFWALNPKLKSFWSYIWWNPLCNKYLALILNLIIKYELKLNRNNTLIYKSLQIAKEIFSSVASPTSFHYQLIYLAQNLQCIKNQEINIAILLNHKSQPVARIMKIGLEWTENILSKIILSFNKIKNKHKSAWCLLPNWKHLSVPYCSKIIPLWTSNSDIFFSKIKLAHV